MFDKRRIAITGGSSGAGMALARALLGRGAHVALLARDIDRLSAAKDSLARSAPAERVHVEPCDVADASVVDGALRNVENAIGPLDGLVTSAGILTEGPFDRTPLDDYRRIMDVNFFGTLHAIRAVVPGFRERGRGRIVVIASVAGLLGVYGYAPYCASKHALVGLAETLRIELAPAGIAMHLVCPPEFDSPMVDALERYRSPENRAVVRSLGVLPVDRVVRDTLRGIEKNQFLIIPGREARIATTAARWFPGLARRITDRMLARARASR